jgi:two-component system, cell cycle sensor histidine kinase and response regulator CckA
VLELAINMAFNEIRHRARLVKDYGEVPAVEADEARLGQVFLNLLVNAAHAIREGQVERNEIRVRTRTDRAGRAVIEIRDTGCGIAPDVLGRIFDPFFTTKAVGDGSGLGLAICHGVVAALGGEITVESEPGKGSVFRVALPPAPLGSGTGAPASRARSSFESDRRGRVLVIDDEAMLTTTIQRILHKHEVTVAGSGREALEKIAAGADFEVILCDLMMPEMTGMDFHAELARLHPELLDRVVFLTGGAFTPAARAFLDGVPNDRLEKPFDPQNLRALVQRFVR